MYTISEIANVLGLYTMSGSPHTLLVSFLLREIGAKPIRYEKSRTPVYTPSVLPSLRYTYGKIVDYDLPEKVWLGGNCFHVRYWPEEYEVEEGEL